MELNSAISFPGKTPSTTLNRAKQAMGIHMEAPGSHFVRLSAGISREGKNPRIAMLSRYPAVSSAETSSTAGPSQVSHCGIPAAARDPWARYHLETKPRQGGMPTSPRDTAVKQAITFGIRFPIPSSSSTRVFPVLWIMAPADMNSVSLIRLWAHTCSSAPVTPGAVMVARPKST